MKCSVCGERMYEGDVSTVCAPCVDKLQAEIERLRQRAEDAESVINSINSLRDKAYEEIKRGRDECRRLLREVIGECEEQHPGWFVAILDDEWLGAARAAGGE